jgi:phenylalanyl-tRNA synthetase beta chain
MGGSRSGVDGETQNLFLESAFFRPEAIGSRARALNLQTESSQRFERGVDPDLQVNALERATELLLEIVGGKPGPIAEFVNRRTVPVPSPIALRHARAERLLGFPVPPRDIEHILGRLAMRVRRTKEGWSVIPPAHRFDIAIEVDLIEEIARLHGYDRIPARRPQVGLGAPFCPEAGVSPWRLRNLLAARDYHEVITYSFVDPGWQQFIEPGSEPLKLANPISADMAVMRTTLWPGLLQAVLYNRNRQQARVRIFEVGRRFRTAGAGKVHEEEVIAGAVTGEVWPGQWGAKARAVDFYDVKGDVEALLHLTGRPMDVHFRPVEHPALHPGQSAAIHLGGKEIGRIGVLHPVIQDRLGLDQRVILFEVEARAAASARIPHFTEISRFPAIRRDLSITVPEGIAAQRILDTIRKVAGNLLVYLELFDEYRGEGIDSGRKSLSLGLTLQDSSRTLKDEEVDALQHRVVATLESELGAQLRE